jgi:hypothetical protein
LPHEFVLQQLDEIIFVIHNQNTRHHFDNIARLPPNTKTARLKPRDEIETAK